MIKCSACGNYLGDYAAHSSYYSLSEYPWYNEKFSELGGFICKDCSIKDSKLEKFYHLSLK